MISPMISPYSSVSLVNEFTIHTCTCKGGSRRCSWVMEVSEFRTTKGFRLETYRQQQQYLLAQHSLTGAGVLDCTMEVSSKKLNNHLKE